jgi:hypothetical protein
VHTRLSKLNRRYDLCPQMRTYDTLRQFLFPYLTHTNQPNVRERCLTTDENGIRFTVNQGILTEPSTFRSGTIFLGGSVCMGWGASSDATTPASIFSSLTSSETLNLGIGAGNSMMEIINAIPFCGQPGNYFFSITGANTLSNQIYQSLYGFNPFAKFEPIMPFNHYFWKAVFANDILFNSFTIRDDLDVHKYFKTEEDLYRLSELVASREQRRRDFDINNKNKGSKNDHEDVYLLKKSFDKSMCLDLAHSRQCDSISILNRLTSGRYCVIIQPFSLATGQRALTSEEQTLIDEHKIFCNDESRFVTFEVMAELYTEFTNHLIEFCQKEGISFIDATTPPSSWCFVDTAHLNDNGNRYLAELAAGHYHQRC